MIVCDSCGIDVLDSRVATESGGDAVELVTTDHDHLECEDFGETLRKVRQVVPVQEQGDQLLQPVNTDVALIFCPDKPRTWNPLWWSM